MFPSAPLGALHHGGPMGLDALLQAVLLVCPQEPEGPLPARLRKLGNKNQLAFLGISYPQGV